MKTDVLHIVSGLEKGGAEVMLLRLLQRAVQDDQAFRHHVLSLTGDSVGIADDLRNLGVPLSALHLSKRRPQPASIRRFQRILRSAQPRVIQGWMYHGNVAATVAARFASNSPAVVWNVRHSLHELQQERWKVRLSIWLNRYWSRHAHGIIYNSHRAALQHQAYGFDHRSTHVIPNGFDVSNALASAHVTRRTMPNVPENAFVFGFVGRYHHVKGPDLFLQALAQAKKQLDRPVHAILAGRGYTKSNGELVQLLESLGLTKCCHLLGEVSDVPQIMANMDVVVSASRGEGFPNIVGEAMLAVRPCIVTDVGDSAQLLGDAGMVIPPSNVPELAQAMCEFATMSPDERSRLGRLGRERIEKHYSLESVYRQYHAFYASLLPAPARRTTRKTLDLSGSIESSATAASLH